MVVCARRHYILWLFMQEGLIQCIYLSSDSFSMTHMFYPDGLDCECMSNCVCVCIYMYLFMCIPAFGVGGCVWVFVQEGFTYLPVILFSTYVCTYMFHTHGLDVNVILRIFKKFLSD